MVERQFWELEAVDSSSMRETKLSTTKPTTNSTSTVCERRIEKARMKYIYLLTPLLSGILCGNYMHKACLAIDTDKPYAWTLCFAVLWGVLGFVEMVSLTSCEDVVTKGD